MPQYFPCLSQDILVFFLLGSGASFQKILKSTSDLKCGEDNSCQGDYMKWSYLHVLTSKLLCNLAP